MKKKTYKLKDISYMNLSLNYIVIIVVVLVTMLGLVAVCSLQKKWMMMVLCIVAGCGIMFTVYSTGIKYGQHGLVILVGKLLQPGALRNDFPLIARHFIITHPDDKKQEDKEAE